MSSEMLNVDKALLFGQTIAEPRKQSKQGVKKYTKFVGVQKRTWFAWEKGEEFPRENQLPAIARALRLDGAELTQIWQISKEADRKIREALLPSKSRKPNNAEIDCPGTGSCGRMTGARAGHL